MPEFIGSYRVTCPSCSRVIYYEQWEGKPEVTRFLNCPWCGGSLGVTGTVDTLAVVENDIVICASPERAAQTGDPICEGPSPPPITGIWDWLKKNWMWVASGGLGMALIIALARRR